MSDLLLIFCLVAGKFFLIAEVAYIVLKRKKNKLDERIHKNPPVFTWKEGLIHHQQAVNYLLVAQLLNTRFEVKMHLGACKYIRNVMISISLISAVVMIISLYF